MSLKDQFKAAVEEGKSSSAGTLPWVVRSYGISLNDKAFAERCPWCDKKDTFNVNDKTGSWLFGCFNDTCEAHHGGDVVKFLMLREGLAERREACKRLLEIAGIPNPYDLDREERRRKNGEHRDSSRKHRTANEEPSGANAEIPQSGEGVESPFADSNGESPSNLTSPTSNSESGTSWYLVHRQ